MEKDAHNYIKKMRRENRQRVFREIGEMVVGFIVVASFIVVMLAIAIVL